MVSSCSPDIHVVSSNSPDHSHQHCFWGSRISTWFLGIMNISMVSDIASRDRGCLLRILNPENKPYFNLDILLLLRVREILGLRVSESGICECSKLLCNTLTSVPATQPLPQTPSLCLQPVGSTAPCCQHLPSKWDQLYSAMIWSQHAPKPVTTTVPLVLLLCATHASQVSQAGPSCVQPAGSTMSLLKYFLEIYPLTFVLYLFVLFFIWFYRDCNVHNVLLAV